MKGPRVLVGFAMNDVDAEAHARVAVHGGRRQVRRGGAVGRAAQVATAVEAPGIPSVIEEMAPPYIAP